MLLLFVVHTSGTTMKNSAIFFSLLLLALPLSAQKTARTLTSPGKTASVTVGLNSAGEPFYKITYRGKTVVDWSRLGFMTREADLSKNFTLVRADTGEAL